MPRSIKKGPYIDPKLLKKIEVMNRSGHKTCDSYMVTQIYGDT